MSIEAVRDAVTAAGAGDFVCDRANMTYLDGGARELFRFWLKDGRTIEIEVPAQTPNAEIARLAAEKANSEPDRRPA